MQVFLAKFPQYVGRDVWLTGESYAGHYIPGLVSLWLDNPIQGLKLRGFATGNPTTNIQDDFYHGTWKTWAMQGIISRPTWRAIKAQCANVTTFLNPPASCQSALDVAQNEMGNLFNPYDLDAPMCASEEQSFLVRHISKAVVSFSLFRFGV
jgi:serine carboxypeptidase-like clade 2